MALSVSFYRIGTRCHNREHSSAPWATGHAMMLQKDVKLIKKNKVELQETEALKFTTGALFKCCNTSNSGKFKCEAVDMQWICNIHTTLPFLPNQLLNKNKMLSAKICSSRVQICYFPIPFSSDQPSFMHHSFSKERILILLTNSIQIILDSILKNTQCYQGNKHGLQGILEA